MSTNGAPPTVVRFELASAEEPRRLTQAPQPPWETSPTLAAGLGAQLVSVLSHAVGAESQAGRLELRFADSVAARLPWELATLPGGSLHDRLGLSAILRRGEGELGAPSPVRAASGIAPTVCVLVSAERKDRGLASETLVGMYRKERFHVELAAPERGGPPICSSEILHEISNRRRLRDPPRFASTLKRAGTRLWILDLAPPASEPDQLALLADAHEFCWNLTTLEPTLSVLCGVFAGENDRIPYLGTLVRELARGATLGALAGALQVLRPRMPAAVPRPSASVSLWTATPERRVLARRDP